MKPAATWEPIDSISPWPGNPRINDAAIGSVRDSIERFGFGAPLVVRESDRVIIAGHTRYQAAKLLKLDKVPVRFLNLDPAEARALALADNKLGELAEWDEDGLAAVLAEREAAGVALGGLGFREDQLEELLSTGEGDPPADDSAPLTPPSSPVSVAGEVYQLGPHRLICGDCRDPDIVSRLIGDRRINVAFTSPPYASQRKYDESSGFKPIKPDAYVDWFEAVQANVRSSLADDGSWFVNIKEHCEDGQRSLYVKDLTIAHVRQWGWMFVDEFVWRRKAPPGSWPNRLRNDWEPVFHFAAVSPSVRHTALGYRADSVPVAGAARSDHMGGHWNMTTETAAGTAHLGNVVDVGASSHGGHTAAFPAGLPAFFIKAYSDPGDIIFDPFMGSGTTMIAAANEKRIAMGCEISPAYCDIVRQRWSQWCAKNGEDPGVDALPMDGD